MKLIGNSKNMNLLKLLQANVDVHGVIASTHNFDLQLLHKRSFFRIFKAKIMFKF